MNLHSSPPLRQAPAFSDPAGYDRLRELLLREGYDENTILDAVGLDQFSVNDPDKLPLVLHRTASGSVLHTLIRLFLLEFPCESTRLEQAIGAPELAVWREAGLVQVDGEKVTAAVKLLPYQGMVLACDLLTTLEHGDARHYVMGVSSSTRTLANLLIPRQARHTLDLGTGCGILAFLLAGHSDRVIAVDRNPRAVGMAAFNAQLNHLPQVECRESDFFSALVGEEYDLIATNPPFVISPENRYLFRDGGMTADTILQRIVTEAPRHLAEGGFCQILCNWAETGEEDWGRRLAALFRESGCDVLVIRCESSDAATYAATWIMHTERADPGRYGRLFQEWLRYYEENGIKSISSGIVVMRRRSGANHWFRAVSDPPRMVDHCGEAILQRFQAQDFLAAHQDAAALLTAALTISPQVRLEKRLLPNQGRWEDEAVMITLRQGLVYTGTIDPLMAMALIRCDGSQSLGAILAGLAAERGLTQAEIAPPFCRLVRNLLENGFLLPTTVNQ